MHYKNGWIVVDILNLLSETKINYWFKHLLNCNISAILVAIIKLINISIETDWLLFNQIHKTPRLPR